MMQPRKPSMPTPDMEDELLPEPPAGMIPERGAGERAAITEMLFQRMQSASPEEKAQLAELLARVNAESDPAKPGADPTMTQPFVDALMRLDPAAREELMQMAGGLGQMGMPSDPMPEPMPEEVALGGERFEPPMPMPNQMPDSLEGMPQNRADQIPAYMARQQDMPPQQGGVDLMALLAAGGQQPPMNMGSGKPFLSGLMG